MSEDYAGSIVARMETHPLGGLQVAVEEILHAVAILKKLLRISLRGYVNVVNQPESTHRARLHAQTALHPLRARETELALMKFMLQRMDVELLVALEADKIMAVALVIAHKKILTMSGIDVLPIRKSIFYREKRRVIMNLVCDSVGLQKIQYFLDFFVHKLYLRLMQA